MPGIRESRPARAALILAAVASLAAAGVGTASAIAHGDDVPDGQFSFSAKLTMTGIPTADGGQRNSACSGALIAPQWVITAGHCFRDVNGVRVERPVARLTTATVGRTDLSSDDGYVATVVEVRQSPTNDVALAKLDQPIADIKPIGLSTVTPTVGDVVRLTGYGATTGINPVPATRLQTGKFTVTSVDSKNFGMTGKAPESNTSACLFDSGAPYFLESSQNGAMLVSVENNGPTCPHDQEETTTRVDVIGPWIARMIH